MTQTRVAWPNEVTRANYGHRWIHGSRSARHGQAAEACSGQGGRRRRRREPRDDPAPALAQGGKPDGKCNKSVGITPAFSSCSWTADKNQLVTIKAMKGKIVEIAMFGRLWKTF